MINIKHQKYIVKFNDKELVMSFDFNALAEIEELTGGRNIFNILLEYKKLKGKDPEESAKMISYKDMRILLYAGLKSENPDITLEDAGRLAGMGNMEDVLSAILKAFNMSMPDKKK